MINVIYDTICVACGPHRRNEDVVSSRTRTGLVSCNPKTGRSLGRHRSDVLQILATRACGTYSRDAECRSLSPRTRRQSRSRRSGVVTRHEVENIQMNTCVVSTNLGARGDKRIAQSRVDATGHCVPSFVAQKDSIGHSPTCRKYGQMRSLARWPQDVSC